MARFNAMVLALSVTAAAMACNGAGENEESDGGGRATGGSGGAAGGSGGAEGGAGACACPAYDGTMPRVATMSLDCLCQVVGCPESADAFLASVTKNCPYMDPQVTTGCGMKVISRSALGGESALFDLQTGALLGMTKYDDVPWGKCNAHVYQTALKYECASAEVCSPCPDGGLDAPLCQ